MSAPIVPTLASSSPSSSTKPLNTSKTTPTAVTAVTTTGPWPKNLTAAQVVEAKAAIAAYRGYWHLIDQTGADPGRPWSKEIAKYATGAVAASLRNDLSGMAKVGQTAPGTTVVKPEVVRVQPALVTITACIDQTNVQFLDKSGQSIKAPNGPGSYFRHPVRIQVGKYVGAKWLVTVSVDDWTKTC